MPEYTRWLNNADQTRDNEVFAELYAELRRIARSKMSMERQGGTLDTCGLLHEAWLRLEKSAPDQWRDRKQFYAAAAETMRRILVDAARRRLAAKRGGGEENIPLDDELPVAAPMDDDQLLDVHEALARLEAEFTYLGDFSMKLEFGTAMHGKIPGKIHLRLSDEKRSFVVGTFEAQIK